MDHAQVGKIYAKALFEVSQANKASDLLEEELNSVSKALKGDKEIWTFLLSPRFSKKRKLEVLDKSLKGNVSDAIQSLLALLVKNDRILYLEEILHQYVALNDKAKGLIRAKVYSAVKLNDADLVPIQSWFRETYLANCVIESIVQPDLIGGILIRFDDKILDGSLKNQLKKLKSDILRNTESQLVSKMQSGTYYEN